MRRLLLEPLSNSIAAVATPVGDIDDDARRFVAATGDLTVMTAPYKGFPLAASETMMPRFRRSQSNPERYRIYFTRTGVRTY